MIITAIHGKIMAITIFPSFGEEVGNTEEGVVSTIFHQFNHNISLCLFDTGPDKTASVTPSINSGCYL